MFFLSKHLPTEAHTNLFSTLFEFVLTVFFVLRFFSRLFALHGIVDWFIRIDWTSKLSIPIIFDSSHKMC